jgi:hypothetical protein
MRMGILLLRMLCILSMISVTLQGMGESDQAQGSLALWRMNVFSVTEYPLSMFALKESFNCFYRLGSKKILEPFSFFCKKLNCFYIKRAWKYSCINEQGCEISYTCAQEGYDIFNLSTREVVLGDLSSQVVKDVQNYFSEGAWYGKNHNLDKIKNYIISMVEKSMPDQESFFKTGHVIFSDDFLYMISIVLHEDGDRVVLFSPYKPLFFNKKIEKLADCFMRFV